MPHCITAQVYYRFSVSDRLESLPMSSFRISIKHFLVHIEYIQILWGALVRQPLWLAIWSAYRLTTVSASGGTLQYGVGAGPASIEGHNTAEAHLDCALRYSGS